MDLFAMYFSGSPVKFVIDLVLTLAVSGWLIFTKNKIVQLGKPQRVWISVIALAVLVAWNVNIGHKQSSLPRASFDAPDYTVPEPKASATTGTNKASAEESFKKTLENAVKENAK
jgi:hypothetical protein